MIPLIEPMYDEVIPSEVKQAIEDHLDELVDAWETLHPKRPKKVKHVDKGQKKKTL